MDKLNNKSKTFDKMIILFLSGSFTGYIIEGLFCLFSKGCWESHVVTLVGPLNALYGIGAVLFYTIAVLFRSKSNMYKALAIAVSATILELFTGLFLKDHLGMKAWDYTNQFLNYRGIICLSFTLVWGVAGYLFCVAFNNVERIMNKIKGLKIHIICIILSIVTVLNLSFTAVSVVRWSDRHYNYSRNTKIGKMIDAYAPDEWMQKRFVEWSFIDIKDLNN
ncbi:MAG: putative ABC transporter permease [Clostridia bacterium]|nr:putative ABC transporter permease [Clostridia bacterium]MBR3621470.1 putative ABC transporter permease [Clostridia bacterium]MBR6940233.1 putative ABC transporter permease [Clostridia bacterium]